MKRVLIVFLPLLLVGGPAEASKPWPRLEFDQLKGEWIGQVGFGDVFRLNLESMTSGSVGWVKPQSKDEVTVYPISEVQFDGIKIKIVVREREYGKLVLIGFAHDNFMNLKIKGLYGRSKPRIRFLRPDAWTGSLDRLRKQMER